MDEHQKRNVLAPHCGADYWVVIPGVFDPRLIAVMPLASGWVRSFQCIAGRADSRSVTTSKLRDICASWIFDAPLTPKTRIILLRDAYESNLLFPNQGFVGPAGLVLAVDELGEPVHRAHRLGVTVGEDHGRFAKVPLAQMVE